MKTKLAKALHVPLPRVSDWLAGNYLPSGRHALFLREWVRTRRRINKNKAPAVFHHRQGKGSSQRHPMKRNRILPKPRARAAAPQLETVNSETSKSAAGQFHSSARYALSNLEAAVYETAAIIDLLCAELVACREAGYPEDGPTEVRETSTVGMLNVGDGATARLIHAFNEAHTACVAVDMPPAKLIEGRETL